MERTLTDTVLAVNPGLAYVLRTEQSVSCLSRPGNVFDLRCSRCHEGRPRRGAHVAEVGGVSRFVCHWCTYQLRGAA